jgi:hypothetical protein
MEVNSYNATLVQWTNTARRDSFDTCNKTTFALSQVQDSTIDLYRRVIHSQIYPKIAKYMSHQHVQSDHARTACATAFGTLSFILQLRLCVEIGTRLLFTARWQQTLFILFSDWTVHKNCWGKQHNVNASRYIFTTKCTT